MTETRERRRITEVAIGEQLKGAVRSTLGSRSIVLVGMMASGKSSVGVRLPACVECNNRYSKIERGSADRFALALDTKHPASAGLVDAALRAMDPDAAHNEKDAAARAARLKKVLAEMYKGEEIPEDQIIRGLANGGDVQKKSGSAFRSRAPAWMR